MNKNLKKIVDYQEIAEIIGADKWIKKIEKPCLSEEHLPPSFMRLSPGKYEYTCPVCGKITIFEVPL